MRPNYNYKEICALIIKGEETTYEKINVKCRDRELVFVRQLCMSMCRQFTRTSLADIGMYFNRDHATVLHATKAIRDLYDTDKNIRAKVDRYMIMIKELSKDSRRIKMIVNIWQLTKFAYSIVLTPEELAAYCRNWRHKKDGYKEIIRTIRYEKYYARIFAKQERILHNPLAVRIKYITFTK